jgi:predicted TIM-barrel fold metal-dependent hydrolase
MSYAHDDDPGLPIKFGPCSNGEYDPQPLSSIVREAIRRARQACDDNARATGMSRRNFLLSVCGAATTLLALNACSRDEARSRGRRDPGGSYEVPTTATTDPDVAREALAGNEFVFDVQGHFLEYRVNPAAQHGRDFWDGFPQQYCGEDDPRMCFSITHFMEEVFLKSDTSMVVLSALPIVPAGSPMSAELMDETRRLAAGLCRDERVLLHAQALPNVGDLQANLDAMAAAVDQYPIVAWKVFTNYPDLWDGSNNAWRLDDGDPTLAPVGNAFVEQAIDLGVPIICAHKGFSQNSPHASPVDFGPAAAAHPDAKFLAYHSGYDPGLPEGPYDAAAADTGVNRLIASMLTSGVGPNQNVYAELGSTWWTLMGSPDEAAHLLGKLLVYVGEDNVLWGTDALFYGAPQDQIQAFRAFQISPELQEQYGYPTLTDEIKRKILGLNALKLHDVDPITVPCPFTREELEQIRLTLPSGNETFGPGTAAETRAYVEAHQGRP